MRYKEYKQADFVNFADEVLKFWKENKVFEKSVSTRKDSPSFVFYEGPPSANGAPGIHHVMARTIKDIFCRYKTLKGFKVERKGGWDTHGLPVELKVEKDLGITKEDIGKKISIKDYNQKCKEAVMSFKEQWDDLTEKIGYWVDLKDPYITFEKEYIESLWAILKKLYEKDLLYKGYTVQPYSPAAGTGLSSHELNLPGCYRNVKDTSVTAQFKVTKDSTSQFLFEEEKEEVFFLAWTTTPWTLPSNCALTIGKNIDYVKVQTFNPYTFKKVSVILAKGVLSKYFSDKGKEKELSEYKPGDKVIPFKIAQELKGSDLLGINYEQLMPYVKPVGKAFVVIPGDYVTTEDGTGIVHTASVFGADDFRVSQQNNISSILVTDETGKEVPLVDKQGRFVKEVTDFAGKYVKPEYESEEVRNEPDFKPTDVLIAIKLKEENRAFKVEKYEHNYPHCWRTDKPILYYPLDSWFIKTTAFKDKMVELNKTINWYPTSTGIGRFGNWLENLVDWNLSRSRYWGTPLPIWRTKDGMEEKCIGSLEELEKELIQSSEKGFLPEDFPYLVDNKLTENFDLHRPFVDEVILVSSKGEPMYREADLIDVWFDSGAMPYAQWGYPVKNKDVFESKFPADYISEGVDQTRGWFFTLHALAVMLEDSVAFKNVISTGLVLDKEGNKMSKRLGNTVNPFEILSKYGPDIARWYMIENAPPWDNLKFNIEGLDETKRKFFGTLYNTYSFFALYANLDNFSFLESDNSQSHKSESDRWIVSRLNSLIKEVEESLENYDPTLATRAIQSFVIDDLSNWYVRLNRKRFWKSELNEDKVSAYQTLYLCLETVAKLMAPIAPFYAEKLFRDLNAVTKREDVLSVHLSNFPASDESLIDKNLEERIALSQTISSLIHSIRKKEKIKVRQPLSKILIPDLNEHLTQQIKKVEEIILNEVNVKKIDFLEGNSGVFVKKAKPNFRKLGQKYKSLMGLLSKEIQALDNEKITLLEEGKTIELNLEGNVVELSNEDIEIITEDIPGWSIAKENGLTVALDLAISDELKKEGIARDIVNKVQNMRKDSGFEVQDKIKIAIKKSESIINNAVLDHKNYICTETQATSLELADQVNQKAVDNLELDNQEVVIGIEK